MGSRVCTRRAWLSGMAAVPLANASPSKPIRGIFIIMATPFTESGAVDYDDLEREVDFLVRCGVHGMGYWPQLASEYASLSQDERAGDGAARQGIARKGPYARPRRPRCERRGGSRVSQKAEDVEPDALIAIPPTDAGSVDDFRRYYAALASSTKRPLFIQTTGGAKGITPPVEMITSLAKEFPHLGYVKEEAEPVIERMLALANARPLVKSLFSGAAGRGMLYEWRLGMDGTMPGARFSDVYVRIWDAWHANDREQAPCDFFQASADDQPRCSHSWHSPIHHETAGSVQEHRISAPKHQTKREGGGGN